MQQESTIVAIATPAGRGGIGIVRLSGAGARAIGEGVCARALVARRAHRVRFGDARGGTIDDGIALLFAAPASFTGEDVVELQAHGSPAVLAELVARCCTLGARLARPGEFSERAWRNGRLDLVQAEAIADLIAAGDAQSARAARRSLEGEFSRRVDALANALLALRIQAEAGIDFADEPIESLGPEALGATLAAARERFEALLHAAERGRRLRDGLHVVIVGPPNVGKSSLLNALAGGDRAIVTDIAGTTRDLLRETVHVDGVELTLVDTAGLRAGGDAVEREGMRRAQAELRQADLALAVLDAGDPDTGWMAMREALAGVPCTLRLLNKSDLLPDGFEQDKLEQHGSVYDGLAFDGASAGTLRISALTGQGLASLHARLRELSLGSADGEGAFTARARHLDALRRAGAALGEAAATFAIPAPELAAESLRLAHEALGEITGRVTADELIGRIFSTFCIGK